MATIKTLKPSISELSPQEALNLVITLRGARRTFKKHFKATTTKTTKTARITSRKKQTPDELLAALNSDDLLKLIAQVEAKLEG